MPESTSSAARPSAIRLYGKSWFADSATAHRKVLMMRLSQNKLEMASVVLFQVEVFWIFL